MKQKKPKPSDIETRNDEFKRLMEEASDGTSWKSNYNAMRIKAKNEVGQYNPSTGRRDYNPNFDKPGRIGRKRRMK